MHGRRREEYKARLADTKTATALAQKAQQWNSLSSELLGGNKLPETQAFPLTEKLLLVNPDPLVLWNRRRKLLLSSGDDSSTINIDKELSLTQACLERNPKAYGAWFHRKWILWRYCAANTPLLQHELVLCALFLLKDERNFHCWNFRKCVVGLLLGESLDGSWNSEESGATPTMGAQVVVTSKSTTDATKESSVDQDAIIQAEWDFTSQKIQQNFSNYSAVSYRSQLLSLRLQKSGSTSLLQQELELVHNAIFTEPDDQTAWWYLTFLVRDAFAPVSVEMLQHEVDLLRELQEAEEGNCKWAWLGIHTVLSELQKQEQVIAEEELQECLERLVELDPDRAARYKSMMK